ncbi:MAG TPA: hypothetical protein VHA13_01350, partial [Gammaproteobacteria bacterium]|nr:hypothetical protein [Gammaproteobacteria bacterium]
DSFINIETRKAVIAKKIKALKELKNALPSLRDLMLSQLKQKTLDMARVSEIQTSIAMIVANTVNNSLKHEHQARFELATINLKNDAKWKVIIGAILGAVTVIIALTALMLSGIGIPLGITIGASLAGAVVGGSIGALTHKNPTKQINSSAKTLVEFADKQKAGIDMNSHSKLTPEQAEFSKALLNEIDGLLKQIPPKQTGYFRIPFNGRGILENTIEEILLSMREQVSQGKIYERFELQQLLHQVKKIDVAVDKFLDNRKINALSTTKLLKLIYNIQNSTARATKASITEKKATTNDTSKKYIITVDMKRDHETNSFIMQLNSPLLSASLARRDYIGFCLDHKISEHRQLSGVETLELTEIQLNSLIDLLDDKAIKLIREITDEEELQAKIEAENVKQAAELAKQKLKEDRLYFLKSVANKIDLILLDFSLDDKLELPQFNLASIFKKDKVTLPDDLAAREKLRSLGLELRIATLDDSNEWAELVNKLSSILEIVLSATSSKKSSDWIRAFRELERLTQEFDPSIKLHKQDNSAKPDEKEDLTKALILYRQ